jgi:hypothetical protein
MLRTGRASPENPHGIDVVKNSTPSDAAASEGTERVEVAGIEPAGMTWDVLARCAHTHGELAMQVHVT